MSYNIMELENLPETLQNKPRWMWCVALTTAVLVITVSTISIGALLGYTYCYIEHRNTPSAGNLTQSTNLQIIHMPYPDPVAQYNRTIIGASPVMSCVMMSRIVNIGQAVMDGIPMARSDHSTDK